MRRFIYEAIFIPNDIEGYDVLFPELGLTTQGSNLADASYMAQESYVFRKNGNLTGFFGHLGVLF